MYAKKCNELKIALNDENLCKEAAKYFKNKDTRMLYVINKERLEGIVFRNDYFRGKDAESIINKTFKYIVFAEEKEERGLEQEALKLFLAYKSVTEVPVVDSEMHLLFSYVRVGKAYDVMPERFGELYGGSNNLARFLDNKVSQDEIIYSDAPEVLTAYLSDYGVDRIVKQKDKTLNNGLRDEELFKQYECEVFRERVIKNKMSVTFFELPDIQELSSLTLEERKRIENARELSSQYYLKNYSKNQDIEELVNRVIGERELADELIPALKSVARFVLIDGLCCNVDFSSKYVNVLNGKRVTTDIPDNAMEEIYVFGPCTVFGVLVEDKNTIPSYLQRKLNRVGICGQVINEGVDAVPLVEEIRRFNRTVYKENAIFCFFIQNKEERQYLRNYYGYTKIHKLLACYNAFSFHDYFLDLPIHPNKKANERIAEYMYEILQNNIQQAKKRTVKLIQPVIADRVLINNKELTEYLDNLKKYYRSGENGAIVMNCNPFTKGHLYLIEEASKKVDNLYVFVVSEDKSYFPFKDRIRLVKEGIKNCVSNVVVFESGQFVLSDITFPEYFTKEVAEDSIRIDTSFDLGIFGKYVAPVLGITKRFAGEEPYDGVTRQYNRDMQRILPQYGIEFICIERKQIENGRFISASEVRKLWQEGNKEEVRKRVPDSTYHYLFG